MALQSKLRLVLIKRYKMLLNNKKNVIWSE
nr:MAG TPA: hypothetical protein [Caudoviricetes sp.]